MSKIYGTMAIALLLVLFMTACSNNSEPKSSEAGSSPVVENKSPATVSVMSKDANWNNANLPIFKWIAEETNITIKPNVPAGTYADALALAMAGGDLSDIIYIDGEDNAIKYGMQGALLDVNEHLDQMPHLKAFWEAHPEIKNRGTSADGKTYFIAHDGAAHGNQQVWFYRNDILGGQGLKAPTTWDELHDVLKKLKLAYPDKYPLSFRGGLNAVGRFANAFQTANPIYRDLKTNEVKFGPITDGYRDLLGYLHTFYDEKLLTPDLISITTQQWVEQMTSSNAFITMDYVGRIESLSKAVGDGSKKVFSIMMPPAGPGGDHLIIDGGYMIGGFAISAHTKNLDNALRLIDYWYSDEGMTLVSWGREGESYQVENGKKKMIGQDQLTIRGTHGILSFGSYGRFDTSAALSLVDDEYKGDYAESVKYLYPSIFPPSFTADEQNVLSITYSEITSAVESNLAKFILGDRPLSEWDSYVKEIQDMGLQQVLDVYKTAWDRQ